MTPTSITLERMDFAASGAYACELALEIPLYSKASKLHEVSVIGEREIDDTLRHGERAPCSSLRYPLAGLQLFPNQTVDITCLSTIPSYANMHEGFADVQNDTVSVKIRVAPPPTQLPVRVIDVELNLADRLHRYTRSDILGVVLVVCVFNVLDNQMLL